MTADGSLYLDLLKKIITGTLYDEEPNHDDPDVRAFSMSFTMHYIRGSAISMLPRVRLDNLRDCIRAVVEEGVAGDLIETGVWRGGACIYMRAVLQVLDAVDRVVWVADSFEGLPEPDAVLRPRESEFHRSAMMQRGYNRMAASLEDVQRNFRAYGFLDDKVRFLKGWFQDTLPGAPIAKLAVLRLDGDYYESTMTALSNLYDKVSPGGYVIVDDYGEERWTYCREAVEEFRHKRNVSDPIKAVDGKCVYWRKSD